MKEIKWGMIGCGDVTENKSGPAFQKIAGSSLVAVMRRNGDRAKDYAIGRVANAYEQYYQALTEGTAVHRTEAAIPVQDGALTRPIDD